MKTTEELVLDALEVLGKPVHMPALVGAVQEVRSGIDEFSIRRAVWRLLDKRVLDLTIERRIAPMGAGKED